MKRLAPLAALAALVTLLAADATRADVAPPDRQWVRYGFRLTGLAASRDYVFVLLGCTVAGDPPPRKIAWVIVPRATETYIPLKFFNADLYALKRADVNVATLESQPIDEDWMAAHNAIRWSLYPKDGTWAERTSPPLAAIEDVIAVDRVEPQGIVAHFDKVIYTTRDGKKREVPWTGKERPPFAPPPAPEPAPKQP